MIALNTWNYTDPCTLAPTAREIADLSVIAVAIYSIVFTCFADYPKPQLQACKELQERDYVTPLMQRNRLEEELQILNNQLSSTTATIEQQRAKLHNLGCKKQCSELLQDQTECNETLDRFVVDQLTLQRELHHVTAQLALLPTRIQIEQTGNSLRTEETRLTQEIRRVETKIPLIVLSFFCAHMGSWTISEMCNLKA